MFNVLQWITRRLINSRRSYSVLRRLYLRVLILIRRPHDPDFLIFKNFNHPSPLFIDVGANVGQAAISISLMSPTARILSFEANPRLEKDLETTQSILGSNFSYRICALGPENTKMNLTFPSIGNLPLETRGSLSRKDFGQETDHVDVIQVDVVRFDDLGLDPQVVKIDVEGFEAEVLKGMEETLKTHKPILLIEKSESYTACTDMLSVLGYEFYFRVPSTGRLSQSEDTTVTDNFFAITKENRGMIDRFL